MVERTDIEALPALYEPDYCRPPQTLGFFAFRDKVVLQLMSVRKLESARVSFLGQMMECEKNASRLRIFGWDDSRDYLRFFRKCIPKILLTVEKERMNLAIAQLQGKFKVAVE